MQGRAAWSRKAGGGLFKSRVAWLQRTDGRHQVDEAAQPELLEGTHQHRLHETRREGFGLRHHLEAPGTRHQPGRKGK